MDTNVLIDMQMGRLQGNGLTFVVQTVNAHFIVSFITQIEFLGYKYVTQQSEEFISFAEVIEINQTIIQHCIGLRKNAAIKLPDAIIAATALTNNLTLVTNNEKDFKNIDGLKVINPHKL
jgi:predicted nucleic acid-binding protein